MGFKLGTLGVCIVGITAMAGTAKAVSLSTLLGTGPGNVIMLGNTVYSGFTYGGTTPASDVSITSVDDGSGTQTLSFTTSTGGWTTPSGSSVIGYDVTVTGSTIQAVGLGFTATASGGASAFVGETVTDTANNKDYSLQVFTDGAGGKADSTTDSVTLDPASATLHVIKSIDVALPSGATSSIKPAVTLGAGATITLVDNSYTQTNGGNGTPPGVPEPMSLALIPLALVGLGLRKKLAR